MIATYKQSTSDLTAPGDYAVIYGSSSGKDSLTYVCPCGKCKEPVIIYDMDGITWAATDEYPAINKTLACPEGRWKGALNTVVEKPVIDPAYIDKMIELKRVDAELESLKPVEIAEKSTGVFVDG